MGVSDKINTLQRKEIQRLWRQGGITKTELARRYGITRPALELHIRGIEPEVRAYLGKVKPERRIEILCDRLMNVPYRDIMQTYGICMDTVWRVVKTATPSQWEQARHLRHELIIEARMRGQLIDDIAAWSGLSATRVGKVVKDVPVGDTEARGRTWKADLEAIAKAVMGGGEPDLVAERFKVSLDTVYQALREARRLAA